MVYYILLKYILLYYIVLNYILLYYILVHHLVQKIFFVFPPLKPSCVLWTGASYRLKNTVSIIQYIRISFFLSLFYYISAKPAR